MFDVRARARVHLSVLVGDSTFLSFSLFLCVFDRARLSRAARYAKDIIRLIHH